MKFNGQTMSVVARFSTVPSENYEEGYNKGFNAGYTEGQTDGYNLGWNEGNDIGYSSGKSDGEYQARQEFWTKIPTNIGTKYTFAGSAWNAHTFYPTHNCYITYTGSEGTFQHHGLSYKAYDLAQRLEECGVVIDFSEATRANNVFASSNFTRLPEINFGKADKLQGTFNGSSNLETIDKLIVSSKATTYNTAFTGCAKLANITIDGEIGASINFQDCPLSVESMKSIIDHLKPCTDTDEAYAYTLLLNEDCWARLEASGAPMDGTYAGGWKMYVAEMYRWNT